MLEIKIIDEDDMTFNGITCDGCGVKFGLGEKMITGIESCCGGGCSRVMCQKCISKMYWQATVLDGGCKAEIKEAGDDWSQYDKRWIQGWNDCVKTTRGD